MEFGTKAGDAPARRPAQYGREVLQRNVWWSVAALIAFGMSGVFALAVGVRGLPAALIAVAGIVAGLLVNRLVTPGLERRHRGVLGEERVGAILDGQASQGWLTVHDASTGRGNIDHIAVGPGGLLTIETKSHRGKVSAEHVSEAWLKQAYAERKALERMVGVPADGLLVLSEAYVVGAAVSRQRGVLVMPARMLPGHLARREPVYTPEEVVDLHARVVSALDSGAASGHR
jgi:hypothetical protein